jgi:hypothetical protein
MDVDVEKALSDPIKRCIKFQHNLCLAFSFENNKRCMTYFIYEQKTISYLLWQFWKHKYETFLALRMAYTYNFKNSQKQNAEHII